MGFKQRNIVDMSVLGGFYASIVYVMIAWTLGWNPVQFILYTVFTYIAIIIIRSVYHKPRPKPQTFHNWVTKIDAASFPSLHCARATIIVLHAQQFVPKYTLAVLSTAVVLVMYSRLTLKKHDIYDTVAGVILGQIIVVLL